MKLIHIADLHLDSPLTTNFGTEKGKERKKELIDTFRRIVAYADEHGVSVILIAGDMFDTKKVLSGTFKEISYEIESHPDIDFLYLRGNHDSDGFLERFDTLPSNLKTFGDTWTSYTYGNVVITGAEFSGGNGPKLFQTLCLDGRNTNIVMMHGQLSNYTSTGDAEIIPLSELKGKSIHYLALGHIHSYSDGPIDADGFYAYSGCPEGRGYDETGEKGFVLINAEAGQLQYGFVPFAKRRIEEIKVDVSSAVTTSEALELIEKADLPKDMSMLVKITLTGGVSEDTEIDTEDLERRLAGRYYHLRIKDETTLRMDIESYRYDQSLKGEFIRLVYDSDLEESEKRRVILAGLKALKGEEPV